MQMIDVLKRLAELDAANPNVVKESQQVEECGMMPEMGMPMERPSTPATINMTAGSAAELGDLLKDIVSLAGMKDTASPIPPIDVSPPATGALEPTGGEEDPTSSMRSVIDKLNPSDDSEEGDDDEMSADTDDDSNSADFDSEKEKADETVNSEPNPQMVGASPANRDQSGAPGAGEGRGLKNNPIATPTFESLMAEYRAFVEGK